MKEIGSEFWLEKSVIKQKKIPNWLNIGKDNILLYSGRTAIDFVLKDIEHANTVYFPSYCCDSMIQPFYDRNIKIEFYDVIYTEDKIEYIIDYEKDCDIFFATSYFGFSNTNMDSIINKFKEKNIIIIEDITHRLLNRKMLNKNSDYSIASLRKWFPIASGGIAIKHKGFFRKKKIKKCSGIIKQKINAMKMKNIYMNNTRISLKIKDYYKIEYLKLFEKFNSELKLDYKNLEIDEVSRKILLSINIDKVRKKRLSNAKILYRRIKKEEHIKPLIKFLDKKRDCPLFYPIKLNNIMRLKLRNYLKSKEIYCPIHWPRSNKIKLNTKNKELYEIELSLICDQRYSSKEMFRIIKNLKEALR